MLSWFIPLGFFILGVTLPYKNNLNFYVLLQTYKSFSQNTLWLREQCQICCTFLKQKRFTNPTGWPDVHDKNWDLLFLSHANYNTHKVIKVLQSDYIKLSLSQWVGKAPLYLTSVSLKETASM